MKRRILALTMIQREPTRFVVVVDVVVVDVTLSPQVYTARKAELFSKQFQLADRGAPTTIINLITASNGKRESRESVV